MKVPAELTDSWLEEAKVNCDTLREVAEYIAQRAAEWALSQPVSMEQRIDELEQKNAVFLEALKRARDTAMKYTLVARIPECGHFGGIAQDLDYVYAAIAEVKP